MNLSESLKNLIRSTSILVVLSSLFLFLPLGGIWILPPIFMWAAATPLIFLIFCSSSPLSAFRLSWLAGFIFFASQISWFLSAVPLDWAGIENSALSYVIVSIIWLASAAALSFFIGLFGGFLKKFSVDSWWYIAPSLFVILEYARAWGFGLWWIGKESLLGPYWTFGHLGYVAVNVRPILYLSKLIGLYGMSFLFIALSTFFFYAILCGLGYGDKKNLMGLKRTGFMLAIGVLSVMVAPYFALTGKVTEIKHVALVQTNFLQQFHFSKTSFMSRAIDNIEKIKNTLKESPETDIVVLPEGSLVTTYWGDDAPEQLKKIASSEKKILLIDAVKFAMNTPSPERIYYLDNKTGLVAYKDKNFLIPGGEYIPYSVKAIVAVVGLNSWLSGFNASRGFTKSTPPPRNLDGNLQKEGVLACSGVLSQDLYAGLVKNGAEILVNTASQSTFRGNKLFLAQSENMIRFTAASTDRYFIQASNGGLNYVINNDGELKKKSAGLGFSILTDKVEYRGTKTPAILYPNWPVFVFLLIIAAKILTMRKNAHCPGLKYGPENI